MATIELPIVGPLPDTAEWYEARLRGLGASETPDVCGVGYGTALQVYLLKRGEIDRKPAVEAMERGRDFQAPILRAFHRETGKRVLDNLPLYQHPRYAWLLATPDGLIPGEGELVECKATNVYSAKQMLGRPGTDEVPEAWLVQAQQQLAVTGCKRVWFPVLIDTVAPLLIYRVERNERLIASLIEIAGDFWQRVIDGRPPEPDFEREVDQALLSALAPTDRKRVPVDAQTARLWAAYERARARAARAEKLRKSLQARIVHALGDAELADLPDGRELARHRVDVPPHVTRGSCYYRLTCRAKPDGRRRPPRRPWQ